MHLVTLLSLILIMLDLFLQLRLPYWVVLQIRGFFSSQSWKWGEEESHSHSTLYCLRLFIITSQVDQLHLSVVEELSPAVIGQKEHKTLRCSRTAWKFTVPESKFPFLILCQKWGQPRLTLQTFAPVLVVAFEKRKVHDCEKKHDIGVT